MTLNQPRTLPQWIAIIVTLLLALVSVAGSYSSSKTTTDQHEKRITVLETDTVKVREMDGVHKQLDRIEDKLDALKAAK